MTTEYKKTTGSPAIDRLVVALRRHLESFMHHANYPYTQNDVDACISLLIDYTIKVRETTSRDEAMEIVESTVLKLNDINENCGCALIETAEREEIAEIIILAGHEMGYNTMNEDITEEWRDW
ncbi:uncharacterized protein SPAPADRAFT_52485 [Spathaspora passalidarum NRRL Y-27907]|uniref:Uncharacterized protein n=1 Tax=Spathaspora passalidarum (strain NRRL Y-27907 / 11-Y1) TaxID=619300 RepID=G3AU20_SPAPN|nr:uncharacterized protein SPAPADRAFT_52485 [Spathaspora passalidarum NRRL Y-27907]EGW30396.1 hypothetical protein SPAPADRAFT_52485 [Spathaspora passalidarum NRRL Y-27907]